MIRARAAGDAAVLLELTAGRPAPLAAAIRDAALPGVTDVVPGARTVLVTFEPGAFDPGELGQRLTRLQVPESRPGNGLQAVEIEVCYDGPDLAYVAARCGLTEREVAARHQAVTYEVGWLGFAPGFGYLTGLDPALAPVPRLDSPRLAVPAGSVAIAGGLSAVYPAGSPGGWRIIGSTSARLWDPGREPPALLRPGLAVRFRAVGTLSPAPGAAGRLAARPHPAHRSMEVLQPGPLTTVQDLGRPGFGHLGVPRSGAADPQSLRLANSLVGNEPAAACLEVTLGRLAVRFDCDAVAALAGAPAPLRLTGPGGSRSEPAAGTAFDVTAGSVLRLGPPAAGLRSYLAVDGGIAVQPELGSRSADLLAGLGPAALHPGQLLPLGPRSGARRAVAGGTALVTAPRSGAGDAAELLVVPGPRADWFTAGALAELTSDSYRVTPASDRTGLRLAGPALRRASAAELPSEGVATGSLQVSHDGQPILLLADHPVTGGYPVIAVVRSADIPAAAQLRPGQLVRFRLG